MDILILNWKDIKHPSVGGAEVIAFEFARRLVKDGHTVTFFSSSFRKAKSKEVVDGVTIIRRGNLFTVYLHAFFYYRSLITTPDKVLEMVNTICWQTWLYIPNKSRVAYLNQLAKEVWFFEFPKILAFVGYIFEKLEYIPYKNTRFLCYSESTKNDLVSYGIPKKNIAVFSLGLDHSRYKPSNRKAKKPLFIFVARLVPMKRADLCIKAMQKVVRSIADAQLAIVGYGPQEGKLLKMVDQLSLKKSVHFVLKDNFYIDKNSKDIKVTLMQQAWALLLPSVKEGWGMVVTEAAACGTPSIVSNVTGLSDSVIRNKTGVILSKNPTSDQLAEAMLSFIRNERKRKNMTLEAIKWGKKFTWNKSYTEFKKLLLS